MTSSVYISAFRLNQLQLFPFYISLLMVFKRLPFSILKNPFIISVFSRSKIWACCDWILCSGYQSLVSGVSYSKLSCGSSGKRIHFQVHSSCWWNSMPCSCRTEVPVFFLAIIWGLPSAPCSHALHCHTAPSVQTSNGKSLWCQIPLML